MKPSLKPAALTQPPEKPLNFTHSGLIHFLRGGVLIVASVSDFDYRSELFQPGGVSEAEWCKNPSPPPHSDKSDSSLFLLHSLPFSAACRPSSRLVLGANCFSQHKSPQRKMEKKDMGREKGKREPGRRVEQRFAPCTQCQLPSCRCIYPCPIIQMIPGGSFPTRIQMRADNSC